MSLYIKKVMPRLCAMIVIALLASGGANAASADEGSAALSGADVLDQAVALYEKLSSSEVEIPEPLLEYDLDEHLLKSVALGYVNIDDAEAVSETDEVRKQDVMTILYKTVINYDDSYAVSEDEANEILNDCYDNAYIDPENRIAYAFMIKQGIISGKSGTEPNKPLTWDSCRILVDLVYDYFIQDVTITINGTPVTIGSNVENILEEMGEPNRIDKSDFGFDWYVYNTDYSRFAMIGVEGGRVCAIFANAGFDYSGITAGSDISAADGVITENLRFITDAGGAIDAVLYNPRPDGQSYDAEMSDIRSSELLDMINSSRAKRGLETLVLNDALCDKAWLEAVGYMSGSESTSAVLEKGYDIFTIYEKLVKSNSSVLSADCAENTAAGISAPISDDETIYAAMITNGELREKREIEQVDPSLLPEYTPSEESTDEPLLFGLIPVANAAGSNEPEPTAEPVENVTAPELEETAPNEYSAGEDITLTLKDRAADTYHLEVYDIEADDYLVNSYIATDDTEITVPAELLTEGLDYTVTLSSVKPGGEELPAEEQLISYGSAYDDGVTIIGPSPSDETYVTDGDYIPLEWESELYGSFYIDVYNSSGELVLSTIIEDENSALIQGLDPGEYYVYVTALRRGTIIEKAQDMMTVRIDMPEPVINEYILDKDDKYYFVYEDDALGVLYFYDEEIVDVEENGETVQKKKIIQKQVKSTKAYRQLAQYRSTPEYTTGDPTPHVPASEMGQAIVDEAMKYLGVPYVWGGTTPSGFDCSGLVQYVCHSLGVEVSRVTYTQIKDGVEVPRSELSPGDLVFFANNGDVHHVGIYIGNNEFIHAPHTGDVVKISSLDEPYYAGEYCGARRVY